MARLTSQVQGGLKPSPHREGAQSTQGSVTPQSIPSDVTTKDETLASRSGVERSDTDVPLDDTASDYPTVDWNAHTSGPGESVAEPRKGKSKLVTVGDAVSIVTSNSADGTSSLESKDQRLRGDSSPGETTWPAAQSIPDTFPERRDPRNSWTPQTTSLLPGDLEQLELLRNGDGLTRLSVQGAEGNSRPSGEEDGKLEVPRPESSHRDLLLTREQEHVTPIATAINHRGLMETSPAEKFEPVPALSRAVHDTTNRSLANHPTTTETEDLTHDDKTSETRADMLNMMNDLNDAKNWNWFIKGVGASVMSAANTPLPERVVEDDWVGTGESSTVGFPSTRTSMIEGHPEALEQEHPSAADASQTDRRVVYIDSLDSGAIQALENKDPSLSGQDEDDKTRGTKHASSIDHELADARELLSRLSRHNYISYDFWNSVGLTQSFTDGIERMQVKDCIEKSRQSLLLIEEDMFDEDASQAASNSDYQQSIAVHPISVVQDEPKDDPTGHLQAFRRPPSQDLNDRYTEIHSRLDSLLNRRGVSIISMRLVFLGRNEETTKPWVVIYCHAHSRDRVEQTIIDSDVTELLRGTTDSQRIELKVVSNDNIGNSYDHPPVKENLMATALSAGKISSGTCSETAREVDTAAEKAVEAFKSHLVDGQESKQHTHRSSGVRPLSTHQCIYPRNDGEQSTREGSGLEDASDEEVLPKPDVTEKLDRRLPKYWMCCQCHINHRLDNGQYCADCVHHLCDDCDLFNDDKPLIARWKPPQKAANARIRQPEGRGDTDSRSPGLSLHLKDWFNADRDHPYPDPTEKAALAEAAGSTVNRVNNWFINARRRAGTLRYKDTGDIVKAETTDQPETTSVSATESRHGSLSVETSEIGRVTSQFVNHERYLRRAAEGIP
jgi:hypothetical protein